MKAYLHHALISTNLKVGFLVYYNNSIYTVKLINPLGEPEVIITDGTDELEVTIKELEGNIVKFLAIVSGNTPYSIFNADYAKIISILEEEDETHGTLMKAYLNHERIAINGNILKKTINVTNGDQVRLTDIHHIDKHSLYNYADRMFKIDRYDNFYFYLKGLTKNVTVRCKREDFSIIDGENYRSFFKVHCPYCGK